MVEFVDLSVAFWSFVVYAIRRRLSRRFDVGSIYFGRFNLFLSIWMKVDFIDFFRIFV